MLILGPPLVYAVLQGMALFCIGAVIYGIITKPKIKKAIEKINKKIFKKETEKADKVNIILNAKVKEVIKGKKAVKLDIFDKKTSTKKYSNPKDIQNKIKVTEENKIKFDDLTNVVKLDVFDKYGSIIDEVTIIGHEIDNDINVGDIITLYD